MKYNSKIIACGSYLPEKIVTNFDLEKLVDTSDEWIFTRTGISSRRIASDNELTSDLAVESAKKALKSINFDVSKIDMIILATTTPDLTFPATSTIIQKKLGAKNAFAFDIQAVCSGFIYALNIANNFIKAGQIKNALVIGSETLSRIIDWKDRNSCILFGDGAGSVILSACENHENSKNKGILSNNIYSDGNMFDILKTSGGTSFSKDSGYITMQGREVFKHAVEKMSDCVEKSLSDINLSTKDIDLLIPHQANARIINAVAKKLGLSEDKAILTVKNHANTSSASIPLALDYAMQNNKIKNNDIVVLEALGGGLTWGSIVIRW